MPKSRGRRQRPGKPGSRQRPVRRAVPASQPEDDMLADVRYALADDHPLALLQLASSLLTVTDRRHRHPFGTSEPDPMPPLSELLTAFVGTGPETAALAWAMAELHGDAGLSTQVGRQLGPSATQVPRWVRQLDQVEVVAAEEALDPLRDNVNVLLHGRLHDHDLTVVSLVDFNLGTVVKDSFVRAESLETIHELWAAAAADHGLALEPLALGAARVRLTEAIENGARTWPPLEAEQWPAIRPLLEWLLRRLPEDGPDVPRPEWSEAALDALARRFLSGPSGAHLSRAADRSIVDDLLWYRTDYGYGDPLRWSPTAVEILMRDWYPRKVHAARAYRQRMPAVLRSFIAFAHHDVGLPTRSTQDAIDAVDALEREYRGLISGGTARQGPAALLQSLGLPGALGSPQEREAQLLEDQVGGPEALAGLDAAPLPDEPFDWTGLAEEQRPGLAEVLVLADEACAALLTREHRTAVRRLLHDVAAARPATFVSRRGRPETAAAAACWIVARANGATVLDAVPTGELLRHFGLSTSPSARVTSMRQAVGAPLGGAGGSLGSARYLTSAQRRYLIGQRDSLS